MTLVRQIDVDSYGLCYPGSKNKYVKRMPRILRPICVDLFGGGGAISHYLARHGAERVIYNDKNKICATVFSAALRGDFPEEDWTVLSQKERLDLLQQSAVNGFLLQYSPGSPKKSTYNPLGKKKSYGDPFVQRVNRFRRIRNAGIADRIAIVSADYSAFEAMRSSPAVAWYIDPPYCGEVGGYDVARDWTWRWCDDIVGPIVGFDSRVPAGDGWRELWRVEQQMSRSSRHYVTLCFYRPAREPTEADIAATAEQIDMLDAFGGIG